MTHVIYQLPYRSLIVRNSLRNLLKCIEQRLDLLSCNAKNVCAVPPQDSKRLALQPEKLSISQFGSRNRGLP